MFRVLSAFFHFPYFTLMDIMHRIHDAACYYKYKSFRQADLALTKSYLLRNPYAMCRKFFTTAKGKESGVNRVQVIYGETFCMTFELIAHRLNIGPHDIFYDLGCGRGRGVFFMNALTGAKTIGVEINPDFVKKATAIQEKLALDNVTFKEESIFDSDLSYSTVLYFYGIAFNDKAILTLIEKFVQLPAGIRIVCVGFSLNDYYEEELFEDIDDFPVFYLWGKTRVYVCQTKGDPVDEDLSAQIVSQLEQNSQE